MISSYRCLLLAIFSQAFCQEILSTMHAFKKDSALFDDDEPSHPGLAVSARLSGENHEVIQSNVSALENWYCEYVKMRKAEGADIGFKSMEGLASCLRYCCS